MEFPIFDVVTIENETMNSKLFISIAPGKKRGEEYDRNLEKDLEVIGKNDIHVIVCLVEWAELFELGIEDYPRKAQESGYYFYHMPIKDHHVPIMEDANILVTLIMDHIKMGHNILIHCSGGVGRSGVIISCCLCKLGYKPEKAVTTVRNRRDGAIKNAHQVRFVKEFYYNRCI